MKILPAPTPKTAQEYAIRQFTQYGELCKTLARNPESGELYGKLAGQAKISHSSYVWAAAQELIRLKRLKHRLKSKPNMTALHNASWLHDVGYVRQAENQISGARVVKSHAAYSLEMSRERFTIDSVLEDCIVNHGRRDHPVTFEGRIIQLSDRLSYIPLDIKEFIALAIITKGMTLDQAKGIYAQKIVEEFAAHFPQESEFQEIASIWMKLKRRELQKQKIL